MRMVAGRLLQNKGGELKGMGCEGGGGGGG